MQAQPDGRGHDDTGLSAPGTDSAVTVREKVASWLLGVVAALLIVGPGLRPGSWFNLDMVVTPITPVPRGVWGLGPELPRRIPYALPLAWASSFMDSTWVVKAMVVVSIAAAVAGAWRLAGRWYGDTPWLARAGSGLLYGVSPFLLTRLGVGHLPLVVAMGMLPWAAPALFEPCRRRRAMFLWSVAIGLTGFLGGMLVLLVVPVAILATPRPRPQVVRPILLVVLSQVPWLVPGVIVLAQGASPAASSDFRTSAYGPGGLLRVLAGHGFWQHQSQVGSGEGWAVPILGVIVVGLALAGIRQLPAILRRTAIAVAAIGLGIPLASALPLVRRLYALLIDSPVSAVFREGERILPLYLLILAPAAAGGAARLAARRPSWQEGALVGMPMAVALLLAGPGLWGINGDLTSVRLPAAWATVRADVHAGGGTTLSLPFFEYVPLGVADDRNTLDPMPIYLGGDVLSSSNPELTTESQERADPREHGVGLLVDRMRTGRPVSAQLARAGIHWVVVRHDRDWQRYGSLQADPGFRHVVAGSTIDLYEVRAWAGVAVAADGQALRLHEVVAPLAWVSGSGPVRWNRPAMDGWMRGWHAARVGADGVIQLPAGGGPAWYWPSVVALLGDFSVALAVAVSLLRKAGTHKAAGQADGEPCNPREGS